MNPLSLFPFDSSLTRVRTDGELGDGEPVAHGHLVLHRQRRPGLAHIAARPARLVPRALDEKIQQPLLGPQPRHIGCRHERECCQAAASRWLHTVTWCVAVLLGRLEAARDEVPDGTCQYCQFYTTA